jgi:hypothetical protein
MRWREGARPWPHLPRGAKPAGDGAVAGEIVRMRKSAGNERQMAAVLDGKSPRVQTLPATNESLPDQKLKPERSNDGSDDRERESSVVRARIQRDTVDNGHKKVMRSGCPGVKSIRYC